MTIKAFTLMYQKFTNQNELSFIHAHRIPTSLKYLLTEITIWARGRTNAKITEISTHVYNSFPYFHYKKTREVAFSMEIVKQHTCYVISFDLLVIIETWLFLFY